MAGANIISAHALKWYKIAWSEIRLILQIQEKSYFDFSCFENEVNCVFIFIGAISNYFYEKKSSLTYNQIE